MFPSPQVSPVRPGFFAISSFRLPAAPHDASLVPRAVANSPAMTLTWMAGLPCYGPHAPADVANAMTEGERHAIAQDYALHGEGLNDPERIINVGPDQAQAHATYRVLCTQLERPGTYCVRRGDDGAFMLVHRSRPGPAGSPLVRTRLERSAHGWRLEVGDTARAAWNGLRGRHFQTLAALKAALPSGMQEVSGASLCEVDIPRG